MPSLDEVYQKFGFVAEAVALLETELGNKLLWSRGTDRGLLDNPDPEAAREILDKIDRSTLGQLVKGVGAQPPDLEDLLSNALSVRNRLFHSFYRQHNFRRNSDEGRTIMWNDLDSIHDVLHRAYDALALFNGVDIDAMVESGASPLPTAHVAI
ncbi:hypothetical protein [Bradyrhizobium sp. Arg816]|uniref:hypothetical protein n=1 Tax=Bradyrhizobium sp. Arg816 TaxID=2998491 RepID=UPI00249EB0BD|nr:hypothetical protein [Bradyrhizobium sp. Arg816]MDI3566653.1 hypothetical protein [Bradyrhizobium sp. Arg816]